MGRIQEGDTVMNMILITGRARVGKTTIAKLIAEQVFRIGKIPVLMSFASPIKEEAERKGYSKEHTPEKYRQFCQELGTLKRESSADYWVHKLNEAVNLVQKDEQADIEADKKHWERIIIIDDCRYLNEIAYGILYKATLLFVSSGNRELISGQWRDHESEELSNLLEKGEDPLLESFNAIILNDKPLSDIEQHVKNNITKWSDTILNCEDDVCDCPVCSKHKNLNLDTIMDSVADFFMFDDLDKEEDSDDTDEETDDSDT